MQRTHRRYRVLLVDYTGGSPSTDRSNESMASRLLSGMSETGDPVSPCPCFALLYRAGCLVLNKMKIVRCVWFLFCNSYATFCKFTVDFVCCCSCSSSSSLSLSIFLSISLRPYLSPLSPFLALYLCFSLLSVSPSHPWRNLF